MDELIIYRDLTKDKDVIDVLTFIHDQSLISTSAFLNKCFVIAERYNLQSNIIQGILTYLLAQHTNAFTLSLERKIEVNDSLKNIVFKDLKVIYDIYHVDKGEIFSKDDFSAILNYQRTQPVVNKEITELLDQLQYFLDKTDSVEEMYDVLKTHYSRYGVGKYGINKAFRFKDDEIVPIQHIDNNTLDELVGLKNQKSQLIRNTEAFLKGKKANNVLLYGDNGTGKSSSVKALLNRYYKDGLRIVEVYKHQFLHLPEIIGELMNHNYKFILFMDDLSFEEYETEYKYLKAVIEGGLEKKPDNVIIYATSNRRHIVKETWNERSGDEVSVNDARQEKLSLFSRFGVQILYSHPDKKMYLEIIDELAKRYDIEITEELHKDAMTWELRHGGYSGRVATQFIHHILGE